MASACSATKLTTLNQLQQLAVRLLPKLQLSSLLKGVLLMATKREAKFLCVL